MAGSQTKSKKGHRQSPRSRRSPRKRSAPRRRGARTGTDARKPADHAREALTEWRKAGRYAVAAVAPMARRGGEVARSLVRRRGEGSDKSLAERLSPAKTDKGGRIGDAADALLGRMGLPGRLASKVALGSRIVERIRPSQGPAEDADEEEPEAEAEEPEAEAEDEEPEAEAREEEPAAEADEEEPEAEAKDEDEEPEAEADAGEDLEDAELADDEDEYVESEPEHAYTEAVRRYRRPPSAYADIAE